MWDILWPVWRETRRLMVCVHRSSVCCPPCSFTSLPYDCTQWPPKSKKRESEELIATVCDLTQHRRNNGNIPRERPGCWENLSFIITQNREWTDAPSARAMITVVKLGDKPNITVTMARLATPQRTTGRRPILSAALASELKPTQETVLTRQKTPRVDWK